MRFYVTEHMDVVTSWLSVPAHLAGWANIVHGGIISSILDEAMGWAGLAILRKLVVSKSLSVDFVKPIFLGQEIRTEGKVRSTTGEREAVLDGKIYDADNEVCATSISTASLFTVAALRKMGVADELMLRTLERIMRISSFDELKGVQTRI